MRHALEVVNKEMWSTSEEWHDTHTPVNEFWQDFATCTDLEGLNKFLDHRYGLSASVIHEIVRQYEPQAESEYDALEQKQGCKRAAKKVLKNRREESCAIRAKARAVMDENGMVGLIVKDGRVFDVHPMDRHRDIIDHLYDAEGQEPSIEDN